MNIRHIILSVLAAFCCSVATVAQLTADKKTQSLGDVNLYAETTASFTLKNSGNAELAITKIVTSNSLVKAVCEASTLAPGGTASLTVSGTASLAGRFTQAVYVYTDQSEKPLMLQVKGRAQLDISAYRNQAATKADPADFGVSFGDLSFSTDNIEFDYVNDGDVVSKTIYVSNNGDTDCMPNLLLLPNYLSVKASPAVLRPGRKGYIVVTLDSRKLNHRMGLTQDIVYASSYEGEKTSKANEIPVSVVLFDTTAVVSAADAPHIELSTNELVLPPMKGSKVKGFVTISNTGNSMLEIKSLQTFHPAVNVSLSQTVIAPGETIKLNVAVVKKYLDMSSASHRILMITNDYKNPVVLIRVSNEQ